MAATVLLGRVLVSQFSANVICLASRKIATAGRSLNEINFMKYDVLDICMPFPNDVSYCNWPCGAVLIRFRWNTNIRNYY